MKNKLLMCLSLATFMSVGLSIAHLSNSKEVEKSEGYDTSSLPKTIDLNDCTASQIRSYYSSLNNLTDSERQGNNLLKNLKTILKNEQKYYSYDTGSNIWKIYEIADRDWEKSPASSTTYGTYNSSTNTITNYTYGTSATNSKNNPYIHALYINRNVTNQTTAWDDHGQTEWGINREHVWPKAEGFEGSESDTTSGGARGDPMHLMAGNGYSNNIHSNYFYGYVKTSSSYTDCGSKYSNQSGNLRGTSKTLNTGTVFEPQDCDKGDIARAIFYMVARYNYLSGSDSDGIDSNNPNLMLTQDYSKWKSTGFVCTTTNPGYMGIMTDLLAWHHADPVDQYEIHRNNLLYKNYTNNRNPFIDFPEWADFIWGTVNYSGNTFKSYSSTPTGIATPSSDTINGYNPVSSDVPVESVSLNHSESSVALGETLQLEATVLPFNATNKSLTWTSSNTSVATVSSSGLVTANASGTAVITAKSVSDASKKAACTINVKELTSISVSGQKVSFALGESFEFGGTVTAEYSDESLDNVTESATFSEVDMSILGDQTVTVSYGGKTATYTINISDASIGSETGSVVAASGAFDGWTASGTGTAYKDGSVKFDHSGDLVYKLDIFSGDTSMYMTKLVVTINGKRNTGQGDAENNTYKVEAISGEDNNITVHDSETKSGASVFETSSYEDVSFTLDSGLVGTTGIRFTYVTKGNGNIAGKSISWAATYQLPTSIEAELKVEKVFNIGEVITQDDITVTTDLGQDVTIAVAFEDYQFTYSDAPSGGALANKTFYIFYGDLDTSLTVQVRRKAFVSTVSDTLTRDLIGVTSSTYTSWSNKHDQSDARYAGLTSGLYTTPDPDVESIQMRTTYNNSGIISTVSGGVLVSVSIEFHTHDANSVNIYVKDTPYSDPADLFDTSKQGTLAGTITVNSASKTVSISGSHTYVGIRSSSGAVYLNQIVISYIGEKPNDAEGVANYIMYEDTPGQCNTKTDIATGYFEDLSASERAVFMNSDDYVIETARERYLAWLTNQGQSINYSNNDYVVSAYRNSITNGVDSTTIIVILTTSSVGVVLLGAYIYFRRKKGNYHA